MSQNEVIGLWARGRDGGADAAVDVHGNAGVGKTFPVRQWEQLARERGVLTACIDESVGSVPEAMGEVAERFARHGHRLKELERSPAALRERRHEAASGAEAGAEPGEPSAASMAAARATSGHQYTSTQPPPALHATGRAQSGRSPAIVPRFASIASLSLGLVRLQ